ncbi:hypothetical protein D3C85_1280070 [compost metagenome]
MSFNITVVAFDRMPNLDDEMLLEYRGFDKELVGKVTEAALHFYEVRTEVAGANIIHVQFRDEQVTSDNMVLVFEDIVPAGITTAAEIPVDITERLKDVLAETMHRLQCFDADRIESGMCLDRSMAFCFLDVRKVVEDDLALGTRKRFTVIKGEG